MSLIKFCEIQDVEPILKNPKKELSEENPVKAYKLTIDTGTELRTVVSAIADIFNREDLLNKVTTFELDLEPKAMRGFISEGMIVLQIGTEITDIGLNVGSQKGEIFKPGN